MFGVSDGLVSNVSLVIGFAGSGAGAATVRLAGLAGLIAGAFSMAAGEYVSVAAQNELIERELDVERRELELNPDLERAELAARYMRAGVNPGRAREVAREIMRDPETALAVHAREELGIDPEGLGVPSRVALFSFVAFAAGALAPVLPWFIGAGSAAAVASVIIGIVAATIVGTLIGRLSEKRVMRSALRQVLILVVACAATFAVGSALGVSGGG